MKRISGTVQQQLQRVNPGIPPHRMRTKTRNYFTGAVVCLIGAALLGVQVKLILDSHGLQHFSLWLTGIGVVLMLIGATRIDPELAFSVKANVAILRGVVDAVRNKKSEGESPRSPEENRYE